jgi:hypothetical protein
MVQVRDVDALKVREVVVPISEYAFRAYELLIIKNTDLEAHMKSLQPMMHITNEILCIINYMSTKYSAEVSDPPCQSLLHNLRISR